MTRIAREAAQEERQHRVEDERKAEQHKAMANRTVMLLQDGTPVEVARASFFENGGNAQEWNNVLGLHTSIQNRETNLLGQDEESMSRYAGNQMAFGKEMLQIGDVDDVLRLQTQLVQMEAGGLVSPEFKKQTMEMLNQQKQLLKYDDQVTRREWKERVVNPILKSVTTPGGFTDPMTDKAFIEFMTAALPEAYAVFSQGERTPSEMRAFRQILQAGWEMTPAFMEMGVLDADKEAHQREATNQFFDAVDVIRREGFARDASTKDVMRLVHQVMPNMGATEAYIGYDEDGSYSEKETMRKMRYSAEMQDPDAQLDMWINIEMGVNLGRTLKGMRPIPKPEEVLKQEQAMATLAMAEDERHAAAARTRRPSSVPTGLPIQADLGAMAP